MLKEPQCLSCKNYIDTTDDFTPICKAFPNGIPMELYSGKVLHEKSYKNDNGYRYERKEDKKIEYLIQDDTFETDSDESNLSDEQKKEYEDLKKKYGIKE